MKISYQIINKIKNKKQNTRKTINDDDYDDVINNVNKTFERGAANGCLEAIGHQ